MQKLSYQLDKSLDTPLYLQLYQQIRSLIHAQELKRGDRLPSKRYLCDYLQISQNTVESAYGQLLAEGYVESVARRGFFVCFQSELFFSPKSATPSPRPKKVSSSVEFDLNPNYIDTRHFPLNRWRKAGKALFQPANHRFLGLGDKQGDGYLRQEIREYLFSSRGVKCEADQIVIGAGLESCIQQLILKDLYLAIATPPAQALAQSVKDAPIVFAAVTDPKVAGIVDSWERPGGNLHT